MSRTADRDPSPVTFRRVELDATADDPIVRSMLRHGAALEPDPRFERRLRGIVLNRHVSAREGHRLPVRRRGMTPIGRGVLVSSVLLAVSVTGVGASSQSALPDDPLYAIKLQIESLRLAVAPPDMRDDLLALSLHERVRELTVAAESGRWRAAEEAAWRVATTEADLVAAGGLTPNVAARVQAHLAALDRVLANAPPTAAAIVAERLDPAREVLEARGNGNSNGQGTNGPSEVPAPTHGPGGPGAPSDTPAESEKPTRSPHPTPRSSESGGRPSPRN